MRQCAFDCRGELQPLTGASPFQDCFRAEREGSNESLDPGSPPLGGSLLLDQQRRRGLTWHQTDWVFGCLEAALLEEVLDKGLADEAVDAHDECTLELACCN
ncbi:hypothetical protein Q664_49805 [Archangium violaceum Cb vi76]|uniref:Uncharacterized protein n=1 Tax=Archangium violaceum Cb vi76 TaxID=1406225 RepID=A0A084SF84_9BACT|nr:hypothetical protein Q664_49805 [Archangium violaceum Cb vi76]